jgi:hypothetical protein
MTQLKSYQTGVTTERTFVLDGRGNGLQKRWISTIKSQSLAESRIYTIGVVKPELIQYLAPEEDTDFRDELLTAISNVSGMSDVRSVDVVNCKESQCNEICTLAFKDGILETKKCSEDIH